MPEDSTPAAYLREHPRMMGVAFVVAMRLVRTRSTAAAAGITIRGP